MDPGDRHRLQLQCAVDGVALVADVEVTNDQVTIQPVPGGPALEIALAAWTQLAAQVIIAAHTRPPAVNVSDSMVATGHAQPWDGQGPRPGG